MYIKHQNIHLRYELNFGIYNLNTLLIKTYNKNNIKQKYLP